MRLKLLIAVQQSFAEVCVYGAVTSPGRQRWAQRAEANGETVTAATPWLLCHCQGLCRSVSEAHAFDFSDKPKTQDLTNQKRPSHDFIFRHEGIKKSLRAQTMILPNE